MSMIRTQVYIPDDLYYQVKCQAQQDKQSISVILRDGLYLGLNDRREKMKIQKLSLADVAGTLRFSRRKTNIATTHNDIYDL